MSTNNIQAVVADDHEVSFLEHHETTLLRLSALKHALENGKLNKNPLKQANAWYNLGAEYQQLRHTEAALYCYRRSLTHSQNDKHILRLANLLNTLNRLDEGRQVLEGLADKSTENAILTRAEYQWRDGNLDDAINSLEYGLAGMPDRDNNIAIKSELARLYERSGEHEKALTNLLQAKLALKQKIHIKQPEMFSEARKLLNTIQTSNRWYKTQDEVLSAKTSTNQKNNFIVGFPRSGTTLINQILNSHPQLGVVEESPAFNATFSEYFSTDDGRERMWALSVENRKREANAYYLALQKHYSGESPILVDKFPLLIASLDYIGCFMPGAKVIVMLRDPRDALISCLFQRFQLNSGMYHFLDIDSAVGFYTAVFEFYLTVRKKLNLDILEVRYEDLVGDLKSESRRITDFLGVDWDDEMLNYANNARRNYIYTPSYHQVVKPIYKESIGRWRNHSGYFKPYQDQLAPFIDAFGYET